MAISGEHIFQEQLEYKPVRRSGITSSQHHIFVAEKSLDKRIHIYNWQGQKLGQYNCTHLQLGDYGYIRGIRYLNEEATLTMAVGDDHVEYLHAYKVREQKYR